MKITRLAALAPYALIACTDFGYRVPPPVVGIDAAAPDAGGGACVEGPTAPSATGPQVSLVTLNVDKPMLQVAAGDVVTWTNTDTMVHTVTAGAPGAPQPAAQGGFDSGDVAAGAKWAYRFCAARTAIYFCKTHPGQMNGFRVVVR